MLPGMANALLVSAGGVYTPIAELMATETSSFRPKPAGADLYIGMNTAVDRTTTDVDGMDVGYGADGFLSYINFGLQRGGAASLTAWNTLNPAELFDNRTILAGIRLPGTFLTGTVPGGRPVIPRAFQASDFVQRSGSAATLLNTSTTTGPFLAIWTAASTDYQALRAAISYRNASNQIIRYTPDVYVMRDGPNGLLSFVGCTLFMDPAPWNIGIQLLGSSATAHILQAIVRIPT